MNVDKRRTRTMGSLEPTRRARGWLASTLALMALLASCTSSDADGQASDAPESPARTDAAPPAPTGPEPKIGRLPREQWQAMKAAGMVRPECPVQRPQALRVVHINFIDFAGGVQRGQLVVNSDVAPSVVRMFSRLFREKFPIRRMRPVENYDGNSNVSLRADNTSAYNCRRADQINAPFRESPHANGRAIDINPRENPWKDLRCRCWFPSRQLRERVPGPGVIIRSGLVWQTFKSEGWIWQNIDVPDYMHFDTGYPSRPFQERTAVPR